jgi:hypothetical protein
LAWLRKNLPLTEPQLALVRFQLAEYACLNRVRAHRGEHIRFQHLLMAAKNTTAPSIERIWHVQPLQVWSALPDLERPVTVDTVFYPRGEAIVSWQCSPRERAWLNRLPHRWQGPVSAWSSEVKVPVAELLPYLERCACVGLVAGVADRTEEKSAERVTNLHAER